MKVCLVQIAFGYEIRIYSVLRLKPCMFPYGVSGRGQGTAIQLLIKATPKLTNSFIDQLATLNLEVMFQCLPTKINGESLG